jgi:hypothetical protein
MVNDNQQLTVLGGTKLYLQHTIQPPPILHFVG